MAATNRIEIRRTVRAERERVFSALTEAGRLREWFCDWARTEPRAGGRYSLCWNSGYEVQGTYVTIDEPEEVTMTWGGSHEPTQTLVKWHLLENGDSTEIVLEHAGLNGGPHWGATLADTAGNWAEALDNLRSVLEQGVDLRELRQPFLGVHVEGLGTDRTLREGIAVEGGACVTHLVEDGAAQAAGIEVGDVIVAVGGRPVSDYNSLIAALQAFRAGDRVETRLVRGQDQLTLEVVLRAREMPEVPDDPAQVLVRLQELQARCQVAVEELTTKLDEEEANREPVGAGLSVKQIVAHLSLHYEQVRLNINNIATGQWLEGQPDAALAPDRITALLVAEPSLARLRARIARDHEDILRLVTHLSAGTLADHYRYRRIARLVLHDQTEEHIRQLRRVVTALREQVAEQTHEG